MLFEIELTRHNVTPSQFLAYVRHYVDRKGGAGLRSDLSLEYFRAGNDLTFDVRRDGVHEKSISRPYEMQTFIRKDDGTEYNEICEWFSVDGKTGNGYYYLKNNTTEETTTEETTTEETTTEETTTEERNTMKTKIYVNQMEETRTIHAATAKRWHTDGQDIAVKEYDENGRITKCVFIPGAKIESRAEKESRENWETCKHIANELECYIDGNYHTCPDCGNTVYIPDSVGNKFKCPDCGTVNDVEFFEQLGVWDYMNDILDIDFLVNSSKEYVAAKIAVTLGGPNIYIDTEDRTVSLYWWTQSEKYYLRSDVIDAVNDWAEDYYNSI